MSALGLNLQQTKDQRCNGATNMDWVFSGVQALILKEYPKNILYSLIFPLFKIMSKWYF